MQKLKNVLKNLLVSLQNRLPERLPVTDAEAASVILRVLNGAGLDPNNDSLRNAIASTLLSLREGTTSIKIVDLIRVVDLARCKQSNYNIIEDIRMRDKAAREAQTLDVAQKLV